MRAAVLLLIPVLAAGCTQEPRVACTEDPQAEAWTTWQLGNRTGLTPWDTLVLHEARTGSYRVVAELEMAETLASTGRDRISPPGDLAFTRFSVLPAGATALGIELEYQGIDGCDRTTSHGQEFRLLAPEPGDVPQPGQGAHVWYAGFWENGTLFGTNIAALHDSGWPRAGWYQASPAQPLRVYVYGEERSEQPPQWTNPVRGTPAEGLAPGLGVGYFTTIRGFNEALKGTETTTTRVAFVAPEDAYTVEGREDHPLYGDALVFLIQVERVVDLPCPAVSPGCPDLPLPSSAAPRALGSF